MSTCLRNLGKYKLQECIGKVGRVENWKAVDSSSRRYVTIFHDDQEQQNDPHFIPRFEREAKVIRTLHHPNIVSICDVQTTRPPESESTCGYLVMDFIEGVTLADYMRNIARTGHSPSPGDIVHLFKAVSSAIDYAHQKGVVHGDIKPANILLNKWSLTSIGEPMLTGFSTAKLLGTCTGVLRLWGLDTPLYLSPEQCQGQPDNEQGDIYALGVILYEMCTGTLPFQGDSPSEIMIQHINAVPKPPILIDPDISPALSAIILHSLEKNPKMRFPNATDMATALQEVLGPKDKGLSMGGRKGPGTSIPQTPAIGSDNMTNSIKKATHPNSTKPISHRLVPHTPSTPPAIPASPKIVVQPPRQTSTSYGLAISSQPAASTSSKNWNPESSPETERLQRCAVQSQPAVTLTPLPLTPLPAPIPAKAAYSPPSSISTGRKTANNSNLLTRKLHVTMIVALISAFAFSMLGTYFVLTRQQENAGSVPLVGHVYFISSGRANINNSQGINDEVQVDLRNIPAAGAGKSYYAWLLGDVNQPEMPWVLLGKVSENQGNISFLYPGDKLHTNLLADNSRFLISEGDAHQTQNNPFLDLSTWRYYAVLPQSPSSRNTNHFSMLDHLRHLLVQAPELDALGLPGGMSLWLLRNTEEVLRWSVEAKDRFQNSNAVRSLLTDILYYLDGECALIELQGVPAGRPMTLLDDTTAHTAQFALLNPCRQEQPERAKALKQVSHAIPQDYLDHILFHLVGMLGSPGATPATRMLTTQINTAINNVRGWLSQLHRDAVQLAHMSDGQLEQAVPILDDMTLQARFAYAGRVDPITGNTEEGATWIYTSIQRLATFDVTLYRR